MKRARWKWVATGAASLLAVAVVADATKGIFWKKVHPEDARRIREMEERFRKANHDSRAVMLQMQKERMEQARQRFLVRFSPAERPKVEARMLRIWKRTGGNLEKMTAQEKALIEPAIREGYVPRWETPTP